jgi:hypothetical protein
MKGRVAMHRAGARTVRAIVLACMLGLALGACSGSNVFEPCDPDGSTPHKPCEVTEL